MPWYRCLFFSHCFFHWVTESKITLCFPALKIQFCSSSIPPPNTPLGTRRNDVSGKETGRVWLVSGTDLIKSPFQPHNGFIQEVKEVGMWLLILFLFSSFLFPFSLLAVNGSKMAF